MNLTRRGFLQAMAAAAAASAIPAVAQVVVPTHADIADLPPELAEEAQRFEWQFYVTAYQITLQASGTTTATLALGAVDRNIHAQVLLVFRDAASAVRDAWHFQQMSREMKPVAFRWDGTPEVPTLDGREVQLVDIQYPEPLFVGFDDKGVAHYVPGW